MINYFTIIKGIFDKLIKKTNNLCEISFLFKILFLILHSNSTLDFILNYV